MAQIKKDIIQRIANRVNLINLKKIMDKKRLGMTQSEILE